MILPSARAPGISSCMRLMQRTSVDLPQPDGPIIAVTSLAAKSSDDAPARRACRRSRRAGRSSVDACAPVARLDAAAAAGSTRRRARARRLGVGSSVLGPVGLRLRVSSWLVMVQSAPSLDERATRVRTGSSATSVSAAPHARSTSWSCAWPTSLKIWTGSEFIWLAEVERRRVDRERGEQQRRRLARAPRATASSDAGDDARAARWAARSVKIDPPARRAERQRRLAQRVGHELEHDLGRARDDRQHQQRERDRALPAGEAAAERR